MTIDEFNNLEASKNAQIFKNYKNYRDECQSNYLKCELFENYIKKQKL